LVVDIRDIYSQTTAIGAIPTEDLPTGLKSKADFKTALKDRKTSDMFHTIYDYVAAGGQPITWGEHAPSKKAPWEKLPPINRIVLRAMDDRGFQKKLSTDIDGSIKEAEKHGIALDKKETSRLKAFVKLYKIEDMVSSKELVRMVSSNKHKRPMLKARGIVVSSNKHKRPMLKAMGIWNTVGQVWGWMSGGAADRSWQHENADHSQDGGGIRG